jgi:hypothetical protein
VEAHATGDALGIIVDAGNHRGEHVVVERVFAPTFIARVVRRMRTEQLIAGCSRSVEVRRGANAEDRRNARGGDR